MRRPRWATALYVFGGVAVLALPLAVSSRYYLHVLTMVFLYGALVLSYNLVAGFAGQFSLAHAAFYGVGAYTSAILCMRAGFPFWLALPVSGLVAAAFGIVLGLPTLRLREVYLTLSTLAFGQAVYVIILNWPALTRGPFGIPGIPTPALFGVEFRARGYYYLALALVILTYAVMVRLLVSRTGRALMAIKEDPEAASMMGVNTTLYRLLALSLSAFFAGMAGSFYAHYITFISADSFTLAETIGMLAMMVLGGMASLPGSLVGPAILILASELLRDLYEYRMLVYGVILVLVILLRPQGLLGGRPLGLRLGHARWVSDRLSGARSRDNPASSPGGEPVARYSRMGG